MEISNWRERQGWMIKRTLLVYRMAHFRSAWCVCLENALSMVFIELFKIRQPLMLLSWNNFTKKTDCYEKPAVTRLQFYDACFSFFVFIQDDPQDWTFRIMPSCPHSRHGYGTVTISWNWYEAGTRLLLFFYSFCVQLCGFVKTAAFVGLVIMEMHTCAPYHINDEKAYSSR